jgi:hypothetical protein
MICPQHLSPGVRTPVGQRRYAVEVKNTIPLWLAVAITVVVSLPFGLWLDVWSLPLWAAFVVWAEYFALGAKPSALKIMVPAYILGVVGATIVLVFSLLVAKVTDASIVSTGDVAWFIGLFLAFCPVIYAMKYLPVTDGQGGLPFFNGISMGLATFFTGLYAAYGGFSISADVNYLIPLLTAVPAILAGLLGAFLGWFNIVIMFPRPVATEQRQGAHA